MVNYKGYLIGGNKKYGYYIECKVFNGYCIPFSLYEDCKDIVNELINEKSTERDWARMPMKGKLIHD